MIRYLREKKPARELLYTCTIITVNNVQIIMTRDDYIDYIILPRWPAVQYYVIYIILWSTTHTDFETMSVRYIYIYT